MRARVTPDVLRLTPRKSASETANLNRTVCNNDSTGGALQEEVPELQNFPTTCIAIHNYFRTQKRENIYRYIEPGESNVQSKVQSMLDEDLYPQYRGC